MQRVLSPLHAPPPGPGSDWSCEFPGDGLKANAGWGGAWQALGPLEMEGRPGAAAAAYWELGAQASLHQFCHEPPKIAPTSCQPRPPTLQHARSLFETAWEAGLAARWASGLLVSSSELSVIRSLRGGGGTDSRRCSGLLSVLRRRSWSCCRGSELLALSIRGRTSREFFPPCSVAAASAIIQGGGTTLGSWRGADGFEN